MNSPSLASDSTLPAANPGVRHLQALQRLRDETLLTLTALETAPRDGLKKHFDALPTLVKGPRQEFDKARSDAKTGMALFALRRVLQMNSLLLENLFPELKESGSASLPPPRGQAHAGSANRKGVVEVFREKLKASGSSDAPAMALGSLAALERVLAEEVSGVAAGPQRPEVLDIILVEMEDSANGGAPLRIKSWKQSLQKKESPTVDARLLNAVFATAIVTAHEAMQAAGKLGSDLVEKSSRLRAVKPQIC